MNGSTSTGNDNSSRQMVVGIGASAGGVEALEKLFTGMPTDLGLAYVVVQHLSSDFESLMPEILSRKTEMPVHRISNNVPVEPNNVYVLTSGTEAQIQNGKLLCSQFMSSRRHHPIDFFLESLAENSGANAIAVILSGTGSDGARGVEKIRKKDGFVVVQSEGSAKFNGMPRAAIQTGAADAISDIEEIPDVLSRFVALDPSGPQTRQEIFADSASAEMYILGLLHKRFGIDFEQYKSGVIARRIERRMMLTKESCIQGYSRFIQANPEELELLYHDLLIGVTEFFRDSQYFDELQHQVLPGLIESSMKSGEFRAWVSPCATGEEAYSIAILIDELIRQRQYSVKVKIFATDINSTCIDFASKGIYPDASLNKVSQERRKYYFQKCEDGQYRIKNRIRQQIVFAKHDVLSDAPFTKLDLVVCRNLLIYFKAPAKKKTLSLFNFSLRKCGVLFLGPSESITELESAFETLHESARIFRKIAPIRFSEVDMAVSNTSQLLEHHPTKRRREIDDSELWSTYNSLLAEFMPPGFLVDENYTVLHVFGEASKILEMRAGRPTNNLLELLPDSFRRMIENGIKRIRIESRPVTYPHFECQESGVVYQVRIKPVSTTATTTFLITIDDSQGESQNQAKPAVDKQVDSAERVIRSLEDELQETRNSLHDSILNLKSTNEEMQSTNEELIAANEELQSTNEELHSVNEELYTVNSEHQRKITELTELTDDMDNLLDSLQVDTIYLDRTLRIRKFTLGIAKTFKLLPQDIGREFTSFNHEIRYENLVDSISSVLETETPRDEEVEDNNGNWYLMRLLPYNSRGKIDGVLLTLIDITKIKETEQLLVELSEIVQASDDAIFRVSADGVIRTWNRGAQELFLHPPESAIGKSIAILGLDERSEGIVERAFRQIQQGTKVDHVEICATRRNGDEFPVQSAISPIYSADGKLDGASIVLRDITVQKKAEYQIREEVKRRDHFLAVLSHELRNPTAAITNALAILRKKEVQVKTQKQAIDIIHRQSTQIGKMLDDLLQVARVTHDKFRLRLKNIDIVTTAKQVVECIEHQVATKNQTLTLDFPDRPMWALVDEARIIQAQTNLLINAIKYTPKNGNILYSIAQEKDTIAIEIKDDGEGMSEDLLGRIFEVFVQADQELDRSSGGMGLGLPLVKMIADAHKGSIDAYSFGLGFGSTFRLSLPARLPELKEQEPIAPSKISVDGTLEGRKLLIVEDNTGARDMLAEFLQLEGVVTETAENGIEGVKKFGEFRPEVCVVDIGLPDMDGFEVARHINQSDYRPKLLVALTGYGQENDRIKVIDAGFDLHLVKPLDPESLIEQISAQLEELKSE